MVTSGASNKSGKLNYFLAERTSGTKATMAGIYILVSSSLLSSFDQTHPSITERGDPGS